MAEDLTYYFHWGPRDAEGLTPSELKRWQDAAERQVEQQRRAMDGETKETEQEHNVRVALAALARQKAAMRG